MLQSTFLTIAKCLKSHVTPLTWMCMTHAFIFLREKEPDALADITRRTVRDYLRQCFAQHTVHNALLRLLESNDHCVITGGFLLAAIRGDPLPEKLDIDLVTDQDTDVFRIAMDPPIRNTTYTTIPHLLRIEDFTTTNHVQVQFLVVDHADHKTFVTSFDLAFCRNYFNFRTGELFVHSISAVFYRSATVNVEDAHVHNVLPSALIGKARAVDERFAKYEMRGFAIEVAEPHPSEHELFGLLCDKHRDRPDVHVADIWAGAVQWTSYWRQRKRLKTAHERLAFGK